jgi:MFS transporter, FHS family, glucose/mannose:H+ symporter
MPFASAITCCNGSREPVAATMTGPNQSCEGQWQAESASIMSASAAANQTEIGLIYFAAIVQGLALVTFPAASSIFTGADGFGFDNIHYGTMFVPQVGLAVLASALAPKLARRWSLRRVLLAGFAGDVVAMTLLALCRLLLGKPDTAFGLLLIATGALGLGFGATVMALNIYAEAFFPQSTDRAVLALNALLGLGTALAPVLVATVVALGAWWLLPVAVACVLVLICGIALTQPLRTPSAPTASPGGPMSIDWRTLPRRFWLYTALVFLYGIVEALNGTWATLYLSGERGVSPRGASLALTAFWAMVTIGRLLIAAISRRATAGKVYVGLAIFLAIAFQFAARVHGEAEGIMAFAMTGLACSAILPLSISFGGDEFPYLSALVAGELIAFYQLGFGVAAFGTGPLKALTGLSLATIFSAGSVIAAGMGSVALLVIRRPAGK